MNYHNIRTSLLSNELVQEYPYFILELKEASLNYTRIRRKDYSMIQIIRILECLKAGGMPYSKLFRTSGFGMKSSFMSYTKFCLHFKLIEKERDGIHMIHRITQKGMIFLDLFRNAAS